MSKQIDKAREIAEKYNANYIDEVEDILLILTNDIQSFAEEHHREKSKWISCEEKLPEERKQYLVIHKGQVEILFWNKKDQCWDNSTGLDFVCMPIGVTYFKQLPEPPK